MDGNSSLINDLVTLYAAALATATFLSQIRKRVKVRLRVTKDRTSLTAIGVPTKAIDMVNVAVTNTSVHPIGLREVKIVFGLFDRTRNNLISEYGSESKQLSASDETNIKKPLSTVVDSQSPSVLGFVILRACVCDTLGRRVYSGFKLIRKPLIQ